MGRPKDHHAHEDLLKAAREEFLRQGVEATRVEDITRRAGRAKGAFYLHFASKEDAFRHLVEATTAGLEPLLAPPSGGPPPATPQAFQSLVKSVFEADVAVFEYLWEHRALVRLMLSGAGSMRFEHLVDGIAERTRHHVLGWIAWGRTAGVYRTDFDAEVTAMAVSGAYDRVARIMVRQETRPDIRHWVGAVYRLVAGGMGTARYQQVVNQLAPGLPP